MGKAIFIYGTLGHDKNSKEPEAITSHSVIREMIEGKDDLDSSGIDLYIDCLSAEFEDVMELCSFFRIFPAPVNVYALGAIMNEASWILFSATGKRIVSKYSKIKITDPQDTPGFMTSKALESFVKAFSKIRTSLINNICAKSNLNITQMEELLSGSTKYLTAEESLEYGLVDEIV